MNTGTTVIDLSSDDETPKPAEIRFIPVQQNSSKQPTPKKNVKRNDGKKVLEGDQAHPWLTRAQLEYVDHVIMIWLNRARRGDRRIKMPDAILKSKAKEAANILNKYAKFFPNSWLPAFKMKVESQPIPLLPERNVCGYPSMLIEDIVRDEWINFFGDDSFSENSHSKKLISNEAVQTNDVINTKEVISYNPLYALIDTKEESANNKVDAAKNTNEFSAAQLQAMATNSTEISSDPVQIYELTDSDEEILNDPIQTYGEALDCLRLVENYALCVRNLGAVGLIAQIEEFLQKEQSK